MPSTIDPLIRPNGSFSNQKAATKQAIAANMNQGLKNPWHYVTNVDIGDGTTDARAAILAADADGPVILPPGIYAIASNMTLTNKVTFEPGAKLKRATGVTITLSDGYTAQDTQQVFDITNTGSFLISGINTISPNHFGTGQAAFKAAGAIAVANQIPLVIPNTELDLSDLSSAFNVTGSLTLIGSGENSLITGPGLTVALLEVSNTSGASIILDGIKFSTFLTACSFQDNSANDPYKLSIKNCKADNFGEALVQSGAGVYCKHTSINITVLDLTNMAKNTGSVQSYGLKLSIVECPITNISNVNINRVGDASNTGATGGILVDCSPSADKTQSVNISNCIVQNVVSGVAASQCFGIMSLEAAASISGCTIDTVTSPQSSSPEAIYTKGSNCKVDTNIIIDVLGKEGCINMKGAGEVTPSINSSVNNNLIMFRSGVATETCRGIYAYDVGLSITNNRIFGTSQALAAFCEGTEITGNTFKDIKNATGDSCAVVEFQPLTVPAIPITYLKINNNTFDNCGLVGNANTYGMLYTQSGDVDVGLVEICNNTFINCLGTTKFGLRILHTGTGHIDNIVYSGNIHKSLTHGLSIGTTGVELINDIEFSNNTGFGIAAASYFSSNAVSVSITKRHNILDGAPWIHDNDIGSLNVKEFNATGNGSTNDRAALAAADAKSKPLDIPPGTYLVSTNLTITNHVTFLPGAVLKPASGVTITLSAGYTAGPLQQVFDISAGGSIAASNISTATPHHFGVTASVDCTAAWQAAIDMLDGAEGGDLLLYANEYTITGNVVLAEKVSFVASSATNRVRIIHNPSSTTDLFTATYAPVGTYNALSHISNLTITGNSNSRYALDILKPSFLNIEHCNITGFQTACIRLRDAIETTIQDCFLQPAASGIAIEFGQFSSWVGTTVSVNRCYLQQGQYCLTMYPGSWYHVTFNDCIFESTEKGIADIGAGNPSIVFNNCYSENIGTDGDGTAMFRIGVTAAGLDKAVWANKSSVVIRGGTYSATTEPSTPVRVFVQSDASRSTVIQDVVVDECGAGRISTTIYTMDWELTNVTVAQAEDENFGDIYDWTRGRSDSIGYDLFPKGARRSVASEMVATGTGTTAETTLDLPAGVKITGISFYVKSPGITADWSAKLVGGVNLPLVAAISGDSNTTAGVTFDLGGVITTGTTNVRLTADSGNFTDAKVQVAVCFEYMHYHDTIVNPIGTERLALYWDADSPTTPIFALNSNGVAYSTGIVPTLFAGDFNGSSDFLTIPKAKITGTEWTYAWYCVLDASGGFIAGDSVDSHYLAYFPDTTSFIHKPNGSGANNITVSGLTAVTTASLIVLRRNGNGNDFDAWQDGAGLTVTPSGTVPDNPSTYDLIGKGNAGFFLDGKLWLLRAWNRALTNGEVTGLSSGVVPKEDLVLDLQFANGTGSIVTDFSPDGNHATGSGLSGGFWAARP